MYPLMQGYDSVYLDVDLEIGGTDQLFNMLVGRELQKKMNNKDKYVMTCNMIMGIDGKPMSKTSGNCIWIQDQPQEMFGKIMSMPDDYIFDYFVSVTRVPILKIEEMKKSNANPRDLKARLAKEIVAMYHSKKAAQEAEKEFEKIFKNKEIPSAIPEVKLIEDGPLNILDLLVKTKMVLSKSEAKRLVEQGGVKINQETKTNWQEEIEIRPGLVIQVGKRKFVKII